MAMNVGGDVVKTFARLGLGVSALALGSVLFADGALAQDAAGAAAQNAETASSAAPANDGETGEEIIVTGTSIRGVPPVGSALISVGRDALEASDAINTAELLREVPQVLTLGVNDSSRTTSFGSKNIVYGNAINLRGVSPYATLTLLDGHRWVPADTIGGTADPGLIPALALQRVEIVADGASAVYGSDAVTGVANLILRRHVEGGEFTVQKGFADNYGEFLAAGIVGHQWGSGGFTLSFQHSYRSNLNGVDRGYYRADLRDRGGEDYRVDSCSPGNLIANGTTYPIPEGGATPENLVAGAPNLCDVFKVADLMPQMEINSGTLTFDQEITDSISIYADGFAGKREGVRLFAPPTQTLTVPSNNPYFVAPAGTDPSSVQVKYWFVDEIPTSPAHFQVTTYQVNTGAKVKFGQDWLLDVNAGYGYSDASNLMRPGSITNPSALVAALNSSDPATAFNPFGTSPNSQSVIDSITNFVQDTYGSNKLVNVKATLDGTILDLPGGALKAALGAEYNWIYQLSGRDEGPVGNATGIPNKLSRNVKSAFVELAIPVFGPDNAIPGFRSLDVSLAGRIDQYNDVGTTKNPKIGVNWEPIANLRLHGSYGTSFRAPLLTQAVAPVSSFYANPYFDPTANNGMGGTVTGFSFNGNNPDLVPETSRTWSFGVDYTPSALPGSHFSINYFDLVYEGQVNSFLNNRNVLLDEALFAPIIIRNPDRAFIQSLLDQGLGVVRGTEQDVLNAKLLIDGRAKNLGTTITRGLDLQATIPIRTANIGDFRFNFTGSYYFVYKTALTQAGKPEEHVNEIDTPQKFRFRSSLGWSKSGFDLTAYLNYINAYENNLSALQDKIHSFTSVDLSASYTIADNGGILGGVRLGLQVNNLFDRDPPFADYPAANSGAGGGYDAAVFSPVGRLVSISLNKKF